MASETEVIKKIQYDLRGPGGDWETTYEDVLGETHLVFKNRHRSIREMFNANIAKWSSREFLVLEQTRITYEEFRLRVESTAFRMQTQCGINKGDRVAILAANSPEWVISFFAATHLGAIVSALNGWWTETEIRHAIELTDPSLIVGDSRRLARAGLVLENFEVIDFDQNSLFFEASGDEPEYPSLEEDDPALILFTSGTTGKSKGALLSHRSLIGFVDGTIHNAYEKKLIALTLLDIDISSLPNDQEIILATSPLFHISGLPAGVLMNMTNGAKLIFRKGRFDPGDVLRLIEEEKVTNWVAIGDMGPRVMSHPEFASRDTTSLARVSSGGAHLSKHMQDLISEHFPQAAHSIGQGYGSSESCGVITSIGGQEFKDNPDSAGSPCLGYEIEIRDSMDNPLSDGEEGEIHVRSAYSMLRYWGNDDATSETLKTGRWLAMGDIGKIMDGKLYINSRARDMIIRSGENIYPVEIEHRLESHPFIHEAAVVGVDDEEKGQVPKAIIVLSEKGHFEADTFSEWCSETLARYKVPEIWEQRASPLPRTASGKVIKGALTGDRELSGFND